MSLAELIRAAWSETEYPAGESVAALGPGCLDSDHVIKIFSGKRSQDLTTAQVFRAHSDSLTYLSPRARHYFLPAFLLAFLDQPDRCPNYEFFIMYHFMPSLHEEDLDEFKSFIQLFTTEQRTAVAKFLDHLAAEDYEDPADLTEAKQCLLSVSS